MEVLGGVMAMEVHGGSLQWLGVEVGGTVVLGRGVWCRYGCWFCGGAVRVVSWWLWLNVKLSCI